MDLEPFDMDDIEKGLHTLGMRSAGDFETSFPSTPKLIEAVKVARAIRKQSSRNAWKPCGECEDCKDANAVVLCDGFVRFVNAAGEALVRRLRSQCYEAWKAAQSV
jgi:hypothetical protein